MGTRSIIETGELHDPYLMADMDKACTRLEQARERKEKVVVFGDYDVDGVTATAVFDNVTVTAAPAVPAPTAVWAHGDIGLTALPGSVIAGDGTYYTVSASGADVWGTADAFHYVYTTLSGDGAIVALNQQMEAGKSVVLLFAEPGCGPCEALFTEVARWQREHVDRG